MPDPAAVKATLKSQRIETPSWGYGNSGTRFKVFAQPGVPRDPYEKLDDAAQVHAVTGTAPTVSLHIPWDKVDDYDQARRACRRAWSDHRRDQLQHLPGRRLQARVGHQPGPEGPPQGRRPPAGMRRHHGRHRLAGPEALVRRRHQLPGPGRHPVPAGPAGRGARRGVRAARRRAADAARVQALRARVLHHRRTGLGHLLRALPQAGQQGAGRGGHRPPRAGYQHRVHRRLPAARGEARAASTSTRASTPTTT